MILKTYIEKEFACPNPNDARTRPWPSVENSCVCPIKYNNAKHMECTQRNQVDQILNLQITVVKFNWRMAKIVMTVMIITDCPEAKVEQRDNAVTIAYLNKVFAE